MRCCIVIGPAAPIASLASPNLLADRLALQAHERRIKGRILAGIDSVKRLLHISGVQRLQIGSNGHGIKAAPRNPSASASRSATRKRGLGIEIVVFKLSVSGAAPVPRELSPTWRGFPA